MRHGAVELQIKSVCEFLVVIVTDAIVIQLVRDQEKIDIVPNIVARVIAIHMMLTGGFILVLAKQ
jgi:hypothetical protein